MHTRSVTMGWPEATNRGNKTSGLDIMLGVSGTQKESVNTELYKEKTGGILDFPPKKDAAHQRKTWSIAECKKLRKWREEGQSFCDLSTVRPLIISTVYETPD